MQVSWFVEHFIVLTAANQSQLQCSNKITVAVIAVFKLTIAESKTCTNVTVLYLFNDDSLKVKHCQITSKTKMTSIFTFKQDY